MSKQRKYIASGGLAFTERMDMKKLSRYAAKGWLLDSFALFGYSLRKGEPQRLVYSVDYNEVGDGQMAEYVEMFEAAGWTKVISSERIHIFSAREGTAPIYSDRETGAEKYKSSVKLVKPLLLAPLATLLLLALLLFVPALADTNAVLRNTLTVLVGIGAVISVPVLMMYVSYMIRLKRVNRS